MGAPQIPSPPRHTDVVLIWLLLTQYGLQAAFSSIERLHHEVTDGGNPIGLDMRTRYVVKGINKEQIIDSKILIYYDKVTGKITHLQDKWDGKLPDSSFQNVSVEQVLSPWWWVHYAEGWAWYAWSFTWDMWWWQVGYSTRTDSAVILFVLIFTASSLGSRAKPICPMIVYRLLAS